MGTCAVDFLPPEFRERRIRRRQWIERVVMAGVVVTAMLAATMVISRKRSRIDVTLEAVEARYADLKSRIAQVETLTRKKDDLSRRLTVLKDILVRARGGRVLEAIGASCTNATLLTKVDVRMNSTGATPVIDLTIEGRCPDDENVANFLDALEAKPLLAAVNLVLSENVDAIRSEKKFVVTAQSPGLLSSSLLGEAP